MDVLPVGRAVWAVATLLAAVVAAITVTRAVVCSAVSRVTMTVDLASMVVVWDSVALDRRGVVVTDRATVACVGTLAGT